MLNKETILLGKLLINLCLLGYAWYVASTLKDANKKLRELVLVPKYPSSSNEILEFLNQQQSEVRAPSDAYAQWMAIAFNIPLSAVQGLRKLFEEGRVPIEEGFDSEFHVIVSRNGYEVIEYKDSLEKQQAYIKAHQLKSD